MTLLRQDNTKEKMLKVNVEFQLEVPVRTDSAGRRLSITDQVSPYISDYFQDLNIEMQSLKYKHISDKRDDFDAQGDYDLFQKVAKCDTFDYSTPSQSEETRVRWEKQKDLECWHFFKMGWKEFKTLSWTDQAKLREAHGVVWENNTWVKKAK